MYEMSTMPPNKAKSFWHKMKKYVQEYNEITGIHGLRYLTEKRSRFEKLFWTFIVLLSLAGCIYMICEIVAKYENSPVVVSFATEDTPIYQIPFPAVTICPEAKYSSKLFNYTHIYFKLWRNDSVDLNETEFKYYDYLNLLCDDLPWELGNKTISDDFVKTIEELLPKVKMVCYFNNTAYDFRQFFVPVLIDEGICFSYNILDRSEIFANHVTHYSHFYQVNYTSDNFDVELGYANTAGIETYPRRALISGAKNSFDIYLQSNSNNTDYACNNFLQGYRMLIHNPWDVPHLSDHYFRVPLDKTVVAAVDPELITTTDSVKKFLPEKRKCYLTHEKPLKYFKIYTQSNCLLDCLTLYTLNKCGCVEYYMPRDNSTPICGTGSSNCFMAASNEIQFKNLEKEFLGKTFCDCKPECTSLKYRVETSHSNFYWREYFKVQKGYGIQEALEETQDEIHWSVVSIYFKSKQFMPLQRNELYGPSDFISNFGGLLGLFTGFSLISLVEIIYFLTLRIYYNRKIYGSWFGP